MVDKAYGWTNPDTDYDAKVLGQVDRSIALAHEDPLPYFVKGRYLTQVRRPEEGIRADDAGLAINPNFAPLHAARGLAEMYIGQYEQGKIDVQQAMRLSPTIRP
jgi:tetratricopeptide (TPR) repeat protein